MKQATILICAFLVIFQVCSTVCDDTDTATNADANTATVRVSDLNSSAGPLNDLSGRWDSYSANGVPSSRNNPTKKRLLYSRRSSGLENSSGAPQLNNERGRIVQTTPQLTK